MIIQTKFIQGRAFLLIVFLAAASSCFGTTAACLTNSTSVTKAGTQASGAPIAAAGGGTTPDDFTSLSTSPTTGCAGTNITFQSLAITSGSSSNGTYFSTLSNQTPGLNSPVIAILSSVRGTDANFGGTSGDTGNNDGINNWVATGAGATTNVNTSYVEAETSGAFTKFFTLDLMGSQLGAAGTGAGAAVGTISGTVTLCLGGTFTGTGGACTTTTDTLAIISGTTLYYVNLGANFTTLAIQNNFLLTAGNGTGAGPTFLTSFEEGFGETAPEPSTLLLLGSSLAGIIGVRFHKVRHRS